MATGLTMFWIPCLSVLSVLPFSDSLNDFCVRSVFLHSIKPLEPSSKLFCIVQQNANAGSIKVTPFRTISHFRKYWPVKHAAISAQTEEIIEIWEDEKVSPFEYPAAVFSDQCTGKVPLPFSANISVKCLPRWTNFDAKHCANLKYLNASYYLHKYSTKTNGNGKMVSVVESAAEKNRLIRWLYWNGTACINAISKVLMMFTIHDGVLEDISANIHYANITHQNYAQQFFQFEAIFIGISTSRNAMKVVKPVGYNLGGNIRIEGTTNEGLLVPSGMNCDDNLKKQVNIRFGIHVNTACRLRITRCAEILAKVEYFLDEWKRITVYSLPHGTNETVTMRDGPLHASEMSAMDEESCQLTTAVSVQFSYERFGNVQWYSHRLVSYQIELNKPDIIDLTRYPYQYIYLNFMVYFIDRSAAPVQLFAKIPTIDFALPPDFFYPFFVGSLV